MGWNCVLTEFSSAILWLSIIASCHELILRSAKSAIKHDTILSKFLLPDAITGTLPDVTPRILPPISLLAANNCIASPLIPQQQVSLLHGLAITATLAAAAVFR
jgi:hypothetical protein